MNYNKKLRFSLVLVLFCISILFNVKTFCGITIDNFENDLSINDQPNYPDAQWLGGTEIQVSISTSIAKNSSAAAKVIYNKTNNEWSWFDVTNLANSDNVHNFSTAKKISADVYGVIELLAKFVDKNGNESGDIGKCWGKVANSWTHVELDYSNIDWRSCDSRNINTIRFFPAPGESYVSGSFYIDNLVLEIEASTSTQKNLLVDDFNTGKEPNNFGGYSGVWPNKIVVSAQYFNSDLDKVYGKTGYSLKLQYGIYPYNGECGYYTLLNNYDISGYNSISFWVRGEVGGETFKVGLKEVSGIENKVEVIDYLPGGITTSWKKVVIPLSVFVGRKEAVENISFTFPAYSQGIVYIDNIVFSSYTPPVPTMITNFETGSDPNNFGGNLGGLGSGRFSYSTSSVYSGYYSGRIESGNEGLLDDFNDGSDPNNYGGTNLNPFSSNGNSSSVEYSSTVYYGVSGYSIKNVFDISSSSTTDAGFWCNLGPIGNYHNCIGDYLSFWIKSDKNGVAMRVGLKDNNGREPKIPVFNISTTWQEVVIKLSSFSAVNPNFDRTQVVLLSFAFQQDLGGPTSATVYIDDIQFGRNGGWITVNNADITSFDNLTFMAKGVSGNEILKVRIQDSLGNDSNEEEVLIKTSWEEIVLPLNNFTGVDKTKINAIHLGLLPYGATVYIDNISFVKGVYDTTPPLAPTNLKTNGELIKDNFVFNPHSILSAEAPSWQQDPTMECVRFEYSTNGIDWYLIGTDYDTDDTVYQVGWNPTELIGKTGYQIRAIAQDVKGNEAISNIYKNCSFEFAEIVVYPNPYYPSLNNRINFVNIPKNSVVKIYTISAELVQTLKDDGTLGDELKDDGKISWNGKNFSGETVASGIYLYVVIKDTKKINSGKFVVIK